jgi:beta-glucanase (GH16 family)
MRPRLSLIAAATAALQLPVLAAVAAPAAATQAADSAAAVTAAAVNWQLVWADEFDGPDGSDVDRTKWVLETGGNGWGNNELQYYRDDLANAHLEGGVLVITAIRERYTGPDNVTREYTSARLKTQGLFEQPYGRFEARLKVPYGQGIWPAFWMLGNDIGTVSWPACGEIDVMEHIGREPTLVHGTVHGPGYSGAAGIGAPYSLPGEAPIAEDFHLFAVEWEPEAIRWYVDGVRYHTLTPASLPAGARWAFDHPFFMLLNLAVGGNWPGPPDASTEFPQRLLVDYVRVYRAGGPVVTRPTVTAADPKSGARNGTLEVRILGTGFVEGARVSFGAGVGVLQTTVVSPGELRARIKILRKAKKGVRNVTVTNANGRAGTGRRLFTIR